MTNVVIYNRVARQQDNDSSRGEQLARIFTYVQARRWANVAAYVDDPQGGDAE
jgi:hypothetical protein